MIIKLILDSSASTVLSSGVRVQGDYNFVKNAIILILRIKLHWLVCIVATTTDLPFYVV